MGLGRYLTYDGEDYECLLCERYFGSKYALYAHCRDTSRHEWCERCSRVFVSTASKNAHLQQSASHNVCDVCSDDFETFKKLDDHKINAHHFCPACNLYHHYARELQDHNVALHHLCVRCGRFFSNENCLQMHRKKHQPRDLKCYGCNRSLKSFSGMLLHLESGGCKSKVTEEDIDEIAREFHKSGSYIRGSSDDGWQYKCPMCKKAFSTLSALYQHAEDSPRCAGQDCLTELEIFIACRLE
ncbi:hypothetical protein FE257_007934 [Aspergillus nanangensis]|uniref:C2H2-type domain-containing protein n=1 Tax=Aspergillus nanangensis TaxID=2582783 RepID=A0AAD4GYZ2_ASPNN|nr:hypothetical protein FE257_007934 [Aspergillus nanangensis]